MDESSYQDDEDCTLTKAVRGLNAQISFSGSKRDSAHAKFLLDVIEDLEHQIALKQVADQH